jgi:hypothetical protein
LLHISAQAAGLSPVISIALEIIGSMNTGFPL